MTTTYEVDFSVLESVSKVFLGASMGVCPADKAI